MHTSDTYPLSIQLVCGYSILDAILYTLMFIEHALKLDL
jgi:hypothetical protein